MQDHDVPPSRDLKAPSAQSGEVFFRGVSKSHSGRTFSQSLSLALAARNDPGIYESVRLLTKDKQKLQGLANEANYHHGAADPSKRVKERAGEVNADSIVRVLNGLNKYAKNIQDFSPEFIEEMRKVLEKEEDDYEGKLGEMYVEGMKKFKNVSTLLWDGGGRL